VTNANPELSFERRFDRLSIAGFSFPHWIPQKEVYPLCLGLLVSSVDKQHGNDRGHGGDLTDPSNLMIHLDGVSQRFRDLAGTLDIQGATP